MWFEILTLYYHYKRKRFFKNFILKEHYFVSRQKFDSPREIKNEVSLISYIHT